jgi:hypothetical protein
MGKGCPMCKREQPKKAYKEAGGKVNAKKKKKGKATACNDCKAAGGDCVKLLSAAGFVLAGIPENHEANYNGLYSKTDQIVNSRHVYLGPNEVNVWYCGAWRIASKLICGFDDEKLSERCGAFVNSLAASPESISNNSVWGVAEIQENGQSVHVPMRGLTTTAMTVEALANATLAVSNGFDEAIEQAAPSFVLSGLDSNHIRAAVMGVYERQDELEKVNGRFVYKGPDDLWGWSSECGRAWSFGNEENIGQQRSCIYVHSSAPTPETIVTKSWKVTDEDVEWKPFTLTTTAINHKPAELFKGTCTYCVQCREWRRCGKGGNAMYCSEACQKAHL